MKRPGEMKLNEYQRKAHRFSGHGLGGRDGVFYCIFGLTRSLGELSREAKDLLGKEPKRSRTKTRSSAKLTHEAGNMLWYPSELAGLTGKKLNDVARRNLENT